LQYNYTITKTKIMFKNKQLKTFLSGLIILTLFGVGGLLVSRGLKAKNSASASQNSWISKGGNDSGTLCLGSTTNVSTPQQYNNFLGAIEVVGGDSHSLVLDSNNEVWSVGRNNQAQLGVGSISLRQPAYKITTTLTTGVNLTSIDQIFSGFDTSFAIDSPSGKVWGWGQNNLGQLGDGTTTDVLRPKEIFNSNIIDIAAGKDFTLFLRDDNTVVATGSNFYGQLGNNIVQSTLTPINTGLSGIVDIAAGDDFAVAITNSGDVYTWGKGDLGQLGQGNFNNLNTPTQVSGLTNAQFVEASGSHVIIIKNNDEIWEWGDIESLERNTSPQSPGQVINLPVASSFTGLTKSRIGVAKQNSVLIDDTGDTVIWGSNTHSQKGNNTYTKKTTPIGVNVPVGGVKAAKVKGEFIQVISPVSTIYGWGQNNDNNLGVQSPTLPIDNFNVSPHQNITSSTSGKYHTLMIKDDGGMVSCGLNFAGQLGNSTNNTNFALQTVSGTNEYIQASATVDGSYGLTKNGTVFEWGNTPNGTNSPSQVIGLSNIVEIATGSETLLAREASGKLYAYGFNAKEAGVGSSTPLTPTLVSIDTRSMSCAKGGCAYVNFAGDVFTTGDNQLGQLGDNSFSTGINIFTGNGVTNVKNIIGSFEKSGYVTQDFDDTNRVWGEAGIQGKGESALPVSSPISMTYLLGGSPTQFNDFTKININLTGVSSVQSDGSFWDWSYFAPTKSKSVNNITFLPTQSPSQSIIIKGDIPNPIASIPGLTVFCQPASANSTTICRFNIPNGERLPDVFAMGIGNGLPGGSCYSTGSIAFCENVPTGSLTGSQAIKAKIGSGSTTSTGESVIIDIQDTDGDGLPDTWEVLYGLSPTSNTGNNGAAGDYDNDSLQNLNEYLYFSNPTIVDTDGDLINDFDEVIVLKMDPANTNSDSLLTPGYDESFIPSNPGILPLNDGQEDLDSDGFTNDQELNSTTPTDPLDPNSKPASSLTNNDAVDLIFYCKPGVISSTTICEFYLPLNYILPTLNLGIGNILPAGICSLNTSTRLVTCSGVPIGANTGVNDIRFSIGGGPVLDSQEDASVNIQDTDGDGLPDSWEILHTLNPNDNGTVLNINGADGDPDGDGLKNSFEYFFNTNPKNADSDGDGLSDNAEISRLGTDPNNVNSDSVRTTVNEANNQLTDNFENFDNDAFNNLEEINGNSNPFDPTSIPNEVLDSLDLINMVFFCDEANINSTTTCRTVLPSMRLLTNSITVSLGSNGLVSPTCTTLDFTITCTNVPTGGTSGLQSIFAIIGTNVKINTGEKVRINGTSQLDTDGDGLSDQWESDNNLNQNSSNGNDGASGDPDADGLTNIQEYNNGTHPNKKDTDGDGVGDGDEIYKLSTSPLDSDSNSLRTPNSNEAGNGTNDANEDFDSDGFSNIDELNGGTDPFLANSRPGSNFDTQDIENLTIYCREENINSVTTCQFTLAQNKTLPTGFKIGISDASPAGSCIASGSEVTCTNIPTGSFEGLQFVYGQIGSGQKISSGERVRIIGNAQLDSDNDGLPDQWELDFDLDERSAEGKDGASGDPDDDKYTNIREFNFGTDPLRADSDSDGVNDYDEIEILHTDPIDADSDSTTTKSKDESKNNINDGNEDFDGDGFTNRQEISARSNIFGEGGLIIGVGPNGEPVTDSTGGVNNSGTNGGAISNPGTVGKDILDNLNGTNRTGGWQIWAGFSSIVFAFILSVSWWGSSFTKKMKKDIPGKKI
jgi:alpha-tubulin suppressor-like RCC1 family protein